MEIGSSNVYKILKTMICKKMNDANNKGYSHLIHFLQILWHTSQKWLWYGIDSF